MLTGILGLVMLWSACLPAIAAAVREPVQSIQPLLISAIQQGQAQGVLVGPAALPASRPRMFAAGTTRAPALPAPLSFGTPVSGRFISDGMFQGL